MGCLAPVSTENKALPWLNLVAFLVTIVINALSSSGVIGTPVGEVSDAYRTMITPNSSAFVIWGIIYFCLAVFIIYQLIPSIRDDQLVFSCIGYWFVLSCVFNSAWILFFVQFQLWCVYVSSALLFLILISLVVILVRLNVWKRAWKPSEKAMQRNFGLGFLEYLCVDFAFSIYAGWCTAASILNVALSLTGSGFYGNGNQEWWAIAVLIIAFIVYFLMIVLRLNWAYGFVCTWAFLWIHNNDKNCFAVPFESNTNKSHVEACEQVQLTALVLGIIAAAASLGVLIYWLVSLSKRSDNVDHAAKVKSNAGESGQQQGITYA